MSRCLTWSVLGWRQAAHRWAFEDGATGCEPGAVQGAVPGAFGVVPAHDPAEVGADSRHRAGDAVDGGGGDRRDAASSDRAGSFIGQRSGTLSGFVAVRVHPGGGLETDGCVGPYAG